MHLPGMGCPAKHPGRMGPCILHCGPTQCTFQADCPVHLPGRLNCIAEALSRNQISCFIFLAPQANHQYLKSWQSSRRPPETPPAQSCSLPQHIQGRGKERYYTSCRKLNLTPLPGTEHSINFVCLLSEPIPSGVPGGWHSPPPYSWVQQSSQHWT